MRGRRFAQFSAFVEVADYGSFTKAAAHLGISTGSLSQTIRALEESLGVRLLNRTTRSVALTEAGERMLTRLRPLFDEFAAVVDSANAFRDRPAGHLRLTVPPPAASHLIAPLLARFLTQYPDIALEISVDSTLTDIVAGRYDAGIRAGKRIARDMIAVRVADEMGHPVPVTRGMKNRFATVRMKMGARHFVMKRLPKIADGAARTAPQWQVNYSNWFDMINAVRYDAFELDGEAVSHFGNCISPSTSATTAEKLARRSRRCSSQ